MSGFSLEIKVLVFLLALATAVGLFYAYTAIKVLNYSYELSQELAGQREQLEIARRLKVELNSLCSPDRLEREAIRLNLFVPKPEQTRGIQ